jgi:hypothetical protein
MAGIEKTRNAYNLFSRLPAPSLCTWNTSHYHVLSSNNLSSIPVVRSCSPHPLHATSHSTDSCQCRPPTGVFFAGASILRAHHELCAYFRPSSFLVINLLTSVCIRSIIVVVVVVDDGGVHSIPLSLDLPWR